LWDPPPKPSIAVLPFANLAGGPGHGYLAHDITHDIITDLSEFSRLFVTAFASFPYEDGTANVQDVARDLGVRYVLEGSVQRAGDRLRIDAVLVDATTGRPVWSERYERPAGHLFAAQKDITRGYAEHLTEALREAGLPEEKAIQLARRPAGRPAP
jgi:adenylate cyclase